MVDLICIDGAHAHSGAKNLVIGEDDVVLALDPWAMHALDEMAIPYRIPEEFYRRDELIAAYERIHEATELLCRIGDRFLAAQVPEIVAQSIYPFEHSIYMLTIMVDDFAYSLFELQKAIDRFRPDRLVLPKPEASAGDELSWSVKDAFDSHMVVQAGCPIPITWLELPADKSFRTIGSSAIADHEARMSVAKRFVIRHPRLFNLVKGLQRTGLTSLLQSVTNRPALLVSNAEYEWQFCRSLLREKGYRLIYKNFEVSAGNEEIDKPDVKSLLGRLEANGEFRDLLRIGDFDMFALLRKKIVYICDKVLDASLKSFGDTQALCRRKNIKGVLTCGLLSGPAHALAAGARALGQPVFTWVHNGPPGHFENLVSPHTDFESTAFCFVGGPGGVRTYESQGKHFDCRILPIGSASLDILAGRSRRSRASKHTNRAKKLVYGLTCYNLNVHVYSVKNEVFSDRLYYRDQLKLLTELHDLKDIEIICKLHPNREFIDPPWINKVSAWGFTVVKDELSFAALLEAADIVILDNANTTIMEALASEKPMFLLVTNEEAFVPGALDKLKRRVGCFTDAGELALAVRRFIDSGEYPADMSDRTFFRDFAVHLDDGQSAKRAVAEVVKEVRRREH